MPIVPPLPERWPVTPDGRVEDRYLPVFNKIHPATRDTPGMTLMQADTEPGERFLYTETAGYARTILALGQMGMGQALGAIGMEVRTYDEATPRGYGFRWPSLRGFIIGTNGLSTPNVPKGKETMDMAYFSGELYTGRNLVNSLARNEIPIGDSHDVTSHGPYFAVIRNSVYLSSALRGRARQLQTLPAFDQGEFTRGFNFCITGDSLANLLIDPNDQPARDLLGEFLTWKDAPDLDTFIAETRQGAQNFDQPQPFSGVV